MVGDSQNFTTGAQYTHDAADSKLLCRFVLGGLGGVVLPLENAGRFAAPATQVIELGAAHLAAAHHLDGIDHRRIEWKDALDALAIGNLAHGEILVEPAAGTADADAFVGLHAAALAFDDLDVNDERIARLEIGDFLAGGKLRHLFVFDFFEQVHGEFSRGYAVLGCAFVAPLRPVLRGLGVLLLHRAGFVTPTPPGVIPGHFPWALPAPRNDAPRGRGGARGSAVRPRRGARRRFPGGFLKSAPPGWPGPPKAAAGYSADIPKARRQSSLRLQTPERP